MVISAVQKFIFHPDIETNMLIQNNFVTGGIILGYVFFTKILGPSLMRKRKPMDLRLTLVLFNTILVASNAYLSYVALLHAKKYWPQRCGFKNNPDFRKYFRSFQHIAWWVYLVKIVELLDTVFFVLRKKNNQISFLHIFHHSMVCVLYCLVLRANELGYYIIFGGTINICVHVIMYSYYAFAAVGPSIRKYLWWKKYLTTIQILQFVIIILYMGISFLTGCDEFEIFEKSIFSFTIVIMVLFFNFYFKAYKVKKVK